MSFKPSPMGSRDFVAIILAIGLAASIVLFTAAALWDGVNSDAGLSENATQVLTGVFGGVVGVLGSYLGYRSGRRERDDRNGDGNGNGG
jgi:membrane associated rhomboid family serine protease